MSGYDRARDDDPDGRVIKGLRFARNAVVHGVTPRADIRPEDGAVIEGNGWTSVSGRLRWRASRDISSDWPGMKGWNAKLITVYDEMVDGRLLEMPIEIAYRWVRTWTREAFGQELGEARSLF